MKPLKTLGRNHVSHRVLNSEWEQSCLVCVWGGGGGQSVIRGSVKVQHEHGPHLPGGGAMDMDIHP